MRCVESGRSPLAFPDAAAVLRVLIAQRAPDGAAVVQRFRPGITEQAGQASLEPLTHFDAQSIVTARAPALRQFNAAGGEFRIRRTKRGGRNTRQARICVHLILQMPVKYSCIARLDGGAGANQSLDVEQIHHGIRRVNIRRNRPQQTGCQLHRQHRGIEKILVGNSRKACGVCVLRYPAR